MVKEKYLAEIENCREKIIDLYMANKLTQCIPNEIYEEELKELLISMCDNAIEYGLCIREYQIRKKQFGRYIWYIKKNDLNEHDIFKIIGDIYKMVDKDDYYFRAHQE